MDIYLYNFTKRVNSTKQPAEEGLKVSVNLKNDTSIYSPIFMLSSIENLSSYTYLKWENRYYYIIDVIKSTIKNVWEINTSLDVLATYKNDIANTRAIVIYSASNYDHNIVDTRLSYDPEVTYSNVTVEPFTKDTHYIVSFVGSCASGNTVAVSAGQLELLKSAAQNRGFIDWLSNNGVEKSINNTGDSIIKVIESPITGATAQGSEILLGGGYATGVFGGATPVRTITEVLDIPWQFNDFRNRSQFTSLLLYLPGYGILPLNADDLYGQDVITIDCVYDGKTADVTYRVDNIAYCTCNIGKDIFVGTVNANTTRGVGAIASGIIAGGVSLASGGSATALAAAGMGIVGGAAVAMSRELGVTGGMSGNTMFEANSNIVLLSICHNTSVEPSSVIATIGGPLNVNRKIDGLSGYIQTSEFSVNTNAPDQIKDQINNFMNGGIYYE